MILLLISAIASAFLFAYEEYQEWLGTKEADVKEHIVSVAHRFSLIVFGILYYAYGTLTDVPLLV